MLLIYASLVPLKYTPLSWEETQTRWRAIEWLSLGIGNRADWIANALVVMPSAFLFSGAVDYRRKSRWSLILLGPVIFLFLAAIVLGIELVQVWFPPRTVSQNDIFAGWVGAAVGIGTWAVFGRWMAFALECFVSLDSALARIRWIVGVLCVASIVYTVYPLDFVLSAEEFREKAATGRIRLEIAFDDFVGLENIKATFLSFGKLLPFGLWLGLSRRSHFRGFSSHSYPFPWKLFRFRSSRNLQRAVTLQRASWEDGAVGSLHDFIRSGLLGSIENGFGIYQPLVGLSHSSAFLTYGSLRFCTRIARSPLVGTSSLRLPYSVTTTPVNTVR